MNVPLVSSSVMTRIDSTSKNGCDQPVARRMSSSSDASAASKWKPSCSRRFSSSITWLMTAPSMARPSSSALILMVALPAISDTTKRVPLPTDSGGTCS